MTDLNDPIARDQRVARRTAVAAVLAGVAASTCCVLPVVLGTASAASGAISATFEPLRPWLIGLTVLLLAVGFYFAYRKRPAGVPAGEGDAEGCGCELPDPKPRRRARVALWAATVVAALGIAFPYIAGGPTDTLSVAAAVAPAPTAVAHATLVIDGMTCEGCAGNVHHALTSLEGVTGARVTLEPPRAVVEYDPITVDVERLVRATEAAGYRAQPISEAAGRR